MSVSDTRVDRMLYVTQVKLDNQKEMLEGKIYALERDILSLKEHIMNSDEIISKINETLAYLMRAEGRRTARESVDELYLASIEKNSNFTKDI